MKNKIKRIIEKWRKDISTFFAVRNLLKRKKRMLENPSAHFEITNYNTANTVTIKCLEDKDGDVRIIDFQDRV